MRVWAGNRLEQPPFRSSAQLRGWLWSAMAHAVVVVGVVSWPPVPPSREVGDVFRWEVKLVADPFASPSSMEVEGISSRTGYSAEKLFTDRGSESVKTQAHVMARRERSQTRPAERAVTAGLLVERSRRRAQPVVFEAKEVVPIESAAVAVERGAPPLAAHTHTAASGSSPDEMGEEGKRDEQAASAPGSSVLETGAVRASMQVRDEPMSDVGSSAGSVVSDRTPSRRDFGWVGLALRARVEESKRYSIDARLNRWEGRTVIAAVILADGRIIDVRVVESSGNSGLDEDARALVSGVSPLRLARPIEVDHLTVIIPIVFALR